MKRLLVFGAAYLGQGVAGFLIGISLGVYLFLSPVGFGWAMTPSIALAIAVSGFLIVGTVIRFRIWVPALLGIGGGLVMTFLAMLLLLILGLLGGIAASGGQ